MTNQTGFSAVELSERSFSIPFFFFFTCCKAKEVNSHYCADICSALAYYEIDIDSSRWENSTSSGMPPTAIKI